MNILSRYTGDHGHKRITDVSNFIVFFSSFVKLLSCYLFEAISHCHACNFMTVNGMFERVLIDLKSKSECGSSRAFRFSLNLFDFLRDRHTSS